MAADPNAIAERWARQMGASTQKWTEGVNGVTVAPGVAAARQKNAYVQGVTANQDKWATNVAAVSLQQWKDDMLTKGSQRIGAGATAAQGKFANFLTQLLPQIDRARQGLPARGSFDQNLQRMVQFSTAMHNWQYKK